MIRKILTILFTVVCLLPALSFTQDKPATEIPTLTFADLKRSHGIEGAFKIAGFVTQTFKCPPCPPGAMCKPCLGDHIVVTDHLDEKNPALIQRLRIFTDKPDQFELKKQYSFTVRVRGKAPWGRAIEEVDLVSFEPVQEVVN
jgi:hypothetical protein